MIHYFAWWLCRKGGILHSVVWSSVALFPLVLGEEAIKIAKVRHVSLNARYISSNLFHRRSQLRSTAPRDEDVRALVGKLLRCCKADTAIAASDECNFFLKLAHVVLLSCYFFSWLT